MFSGTDGSVERNLRNNGAGVLGTVRQNPVSLKVAKFESPGTYYRVQGYTPLVTSPCGGLSGAHGVYALSYQHMERSAGCWDAKQMSNQDCWRHFEKGAYTNLIHGYFFWAVGVPLSYRAPSSPRRLVTVPP